jgi:hypothetical protein
MAGRPGVRRARLLLLAVLTPLALVGMVAWLIPYWIPTLVVRARPPRPRVDRDVQALGGVPRVSALPRALGRAGWLTEGPLRGALVGVAAVAGGLAWIPWRARLRVLADDLRGLVRSLPRGRSRNRLGRSA